MLRLDRLCSAEGDAMEDKPKPRGKPFTGADDPRRNNGGQPKEARELRAALLAHGDEIIERFMGLVRAGNSMATCRAMEWVVGKPEQAISVFGEGRTQARGAPNKYYQAHLELIASAALPEIPAQTGNRPRGAVATVVTG
jgi:hypothetical protein